MGKISIDELSISLFDEPIPSPYQIQILATTLLGDTIEVGSFQHHL